MLDDNRDAPTVEGFGDEWTRFDQSAPEPRELEVMFDQYFAVFPWAALPSDARGFDLGCGSGRWAKLAAPRVGELHCIDASPAALEVARRNLAGFPNCRLHLASVGDLPIEDASMDFGYSLGVLHHVPDTARGLRSCTAKLKAGAPFLLYLYYAFDNRPAWFRALWLASDLLRRLISRTPHAIRFFMSQVLAGLVYYPLARMALILERLGIEVSGFPLSTYRNRSFYVMRTDALDRFGTRLEQRFTAQSIRRMMEDASLERIRFSPTGPFWCAVGFKKG